MRIVGLTGGIASGKSTVSNLFKAHGIPVVDADIVARNVLKKGTGGWKKVVAAFGEDILLENGEVDRAKLGQIVFSVPGRRQLLNSGWTESVVKGGEGQWCFLMGFKAAIREDNSAEITTDDSSIFCDADIDQVKHLRVILDWGIERCEKRLAI